jgi:LysM repeat protein
MRRSSLLGFIILNVIVTFATVFAAIGFINRFSPQPTPRPAAPPLFVVVTATQDPKGTQVAYIVVTATLQPGGSQAGGANPGTLTTLEPSPSSPIELTEPTNNSASAAVNPTADTLGGIPTLDPALLPSSLGTTEAGDVNAASASGGSNCQTYDIKQGDTAGKVAELFGVSLADLMRANNLTDADLGRLQIGQTLEIPVNGCGLETETPTPTVTSTKFILPTLPPTSTVAPTASSAQIEVSQIINPGDVTSEGIELRNISGGVIQMQNWTLSDGTGLKFTFPDYRMFPGGRVTIYTKSGTNTPIVLYWGQARAVWGDPNQTITITDSKGQVQAESGVSKVGSSTGSNAIPTPTAKP